MNQNPTLLTRLKKLSPDAWIALTVGLVALVCYVRTLAPDVLYGDSGEFQALSYMLGITHTTGYPVYLALAKLLGSLIPIGTFAYRVNLLSALYAAGTLGGVYLLARAFTNSRLGAIFGCVALGMAYSFWSQAVIAEIYTLATLAITWSTFCLWRWQDDPPNKGIWLLFSMLLLGLGIHTVVELIVPAVGIFILWTLAVKRLPAAQWWRSIGMAVAGGAMGATLFFLIFFISDTLINPPTSFLNVTLIPSHSLWGATAADLDSFFKRVYNTVFALQWGKALFSGDPTFMGKELDVYWQALLNRDFSQGMLLCAGLGLIVALFKRTRQAGFMLLSFAALLFYIVNYKVSSKYVFYLATYVFITVLMGVGTGFFLETIQRYMANWKNPWMVWPRLGLSILLFAFIFMETTFPSRWEALRTGKATFFTDDEYTFPVKDLSLPRATGEQILKSVPDDAVLLMGWQALYTTAYLANVEQNRPGITYREASPYPSDGALADSLIAEVNAFLKAGRPVYADGYYKNIRQNFNTKPLAGGSKWIQVLTK
jgi:hypothetical protein